MTVEDRPMPVRLAGLVAAALVAAAGPPVVPLAAAERHRPVPVSRAAGDAISGTLKLHDAAGDTWAPIQMENPALAIGDRVVVCAVAREGGYFSVWSRTGDGEMPVRVFPNDYTPEQRVERGGRIDAGQEICLGDGTGGYKFTVTEPYGDAEVYLYWSPELEGQFGPEDIPIIPEYGVEETARGSSGGYSATVLRYRVVQ